MWTDQINWRTIVTQPNQTASETDSAVEAPIFLVVDDHDAVLQCLVPLLRATYPDVVLIAAQDCKKARHQIEQHNLDLVVLDLELPDIVGQRARAESGLNLLKTIMENQLPPHIVVLGDSVKPLVRLKDAIYHYPAGFTAIDKTQPIPKLLKLIDLALRGSMFLPPEVRSRSELKPQWLTLLTLKFQEGLSDRAIAQRMGVSTRTIRSYWLHIQDALEVFDDPDRDLRVQIAQAARQAGLID